MNLIKIKNYILHIQYRDKVRIKFPTKIYSIFYSIKILPLLVLITKIKQKSIHFIY